MKIINQDKVTDCYMVYHEKDAQIIQFNLYTKWIFTSKESAVKAYEERIKILKASIGYCSISFKELAEKYKNQLAYLKECKVVKVADRWLTYEVVK